MCCICTTYRHNMLVIIGAHVRHIKLSIGIEIEIHLYRYFNTHTYATITHTMNISMLHTYLQTEIALGSVTPLKVALNFMMSSMFFCSSLVQFAHVPEAWSKLVHRYWIGNDDR